MHGTRADIAAVPQAGETYMARSVQSRVPTTLGESYSISGRLLEQRDGTYARSGLA